MTLLELFAPTFRSRADVVALEFHGATYTFGDLDRRSSHVANFLLANGFHNGDRLGVYLVNRVEFIDLFLACLKTGIIFLPINILYREREVSHIASDAEPRAIVAAAPVPGVSSFLDVADIARAASVLSAPLPPEPSVTSVPTETEASTPLALVYTSGTTGTAKGAILTHANFVANTTNLLDAWRFTSDDRLLLPLPLFHVHGLGNGVCCWLASGCQMRLLERFDADKAADEFLSFKPTVLFAVPTIYIRMLNLPAETARAIGTRMRLFVSGSAPLPAHVHDEFRAAYGHSILERYGMTETMMNVSNPYDEERRPGAVGFPLPGVGVRIVKAGSNTPHVEEVPVEETGDVWVKGANVFPGYWRRDEATRAAFVDGWFKTGDIGVRSADGYISLRGRATDLIISGGFNIYPREIEEVLLDCPGVREAVVIGVPDPVRGEVPVAYVATDDAYDEATLVETLKTTLASFKMPRAFVRIDKLPRTALGKVQKHLLPAITLVLMMFWATAAFAQDRPIPTDPFGRCEYVTDPQISERVRFALLPGDDLFRPLLTDPKEPRSSIEFRSADPRGQSGSAGTLRARTAGVTAGGVLGLWARKTGECRGVELSLLGGVFGQFNLDSPSHDLTNADFVVGAQIAMRSNRFSGRLRVFHQTSHLGQDFTRENPVLIDLNLGSETVEALGSIDGTELRAYGGLGYVVFLNHDGNSVLAHAGAEFRSQRIIRGALRPVAGLDIQSLQSRSWALTTTAMGGVEWTSEAFARRLRLLVVVADGYSPFGEVSLQRKSRTIGTQLQIEF